MGQISSGAPENSGGSHIISGNGTAGSPDAGVVSVQGVASGTPILVNPAGTNQFYIYSPQLNSYLYSPGTSIGGVASGGTPFALAVAGVYPALAGTSLYTASTVNWQTMDLFGRLRVAPSFSGFPQNVGLWNSVTALNAVFSVLLDGNGDTMASSVPAVLVTLDQTTTLTAGAVTFQISYDGLNYISVPASQLLDPSSLAQISNPYTLQANTNKAFLILLRGALYVQMTLTTRITGSGIVTVYAQQVAYQPTPSMDSSGNMNVNVQSSGTLTVSGTVAVSSVSGSVAVTGTFWQATQPVSISGTINTSDANAQSQGSTTSGQKGFLEMGAVTTAAPTYVTAQTSPLSLDTSGNLRTSVNNTVTVSGTVSVNALPTGTNTIGSVKLTDGTNTAKILAGSTAPAAGDAALEVAINPLSQGQGLGFIVDSTGVQRTIKIATFDTSSSGATSVVSLVAAQKVYVLSWKVSANGTTNVNLQSHTTTSNTSGIDFFVANQGAVYPFDEGTWITTTSGEALDVNNSAAIHIAGSVKYVQF